MAKALGIWMPRRAATSGLPMSPKSGSDAARSIGGLCSRSLRFLDGVSLEMMILLNALGAKTDLAPPFVLAVYSPLPRICGKLTTPR